MAAANSPLWKLWFILTRVCSAAAQQDPRSLAAALQNINGVSSVLSLLPVMSGKTQNVKAVAARTFPASLVVAGLGAGRVLSKLQIGLLLLSADLYRNLIGELSYYHQEYVNVFSYYHQEYVNVFSPPLVHIPTGTPERHSSNVIVNHNPTEDYMVEAWFQTQGLPAKVELSQNNHWRTLWGMLIYLLAEVFETFLGVQNAATGTAIPLIIIQTISGTCWMASVCALQAARGQGKRFIHLNRLATAEYRCFQLVTAGKSVHSAVLSTELSNVREYNLFNSKYETRRLKTIGGAIVVSGVIDILATVLIVGLNEWAYGWLGLQMLLVALKVLFSLEPIRRIRIVDVKPLVGDTLDQGSSTMPQDGRKGRLPIVVVSSREYTFSEVRVTHNIVVEADTQARWHSRTPGIFVGQPYYIQRPELPEKKPTAAATEDTAKLPRIHVSDPEKVALTDPSMFPLPPSPTPTNCVSPTSSESGSTVTPYPAGPKLITEVPRIVVSPESPVVTPPLSLTAPPGIPVTRTTSNQSLSAHSVSTRAPTPPAKQPMRLPARGPPPVSLVTRSTSNVLHQPRRPMPTHSQSAPSPTRPSDAPAPMPSPSRPSDAPAPAPTPAPSVSPPPQSKSKQCSSPPSPDPNVRYLAFKDGTLTLSETEPAHEANQALQREFLACLAEVVKANKVPSEEFMEAIEIIREGIRKTMSDNWFAFGTTDLGRYMSTSYQELLWRRFL